MSRIHHITTLIKRRLGLPLSEAEEKGWQEAQKQEEMKEEQRAYDKVWELSGRYKAGQRFDSQAAWQRFRSTHLGHSRRRFARRRALVWAAAASIALLAGALWLGQRLSSPPFELHTAAGEQRQYTLSDGSTVWLNERSRLEIDRAFGKKLRKLKLEGEAFFNVAPDANRPFVVETPHSRVQVLGTRFNLRHYPEEQEVMLYVEEGRVAFLPAATHQRFELSAGERLRYQPQAQRLERERDPYGNAISWKTHRFKFRNTPLEEVFRVLEYRYRTRFVLEADPLDCGYTNDIQDQPLETLIATLGKNFPNLRIERQADGNWRVSGSCK